MMKKSFSKPLTEKWVVTKTIMDLNCFQYFNNVLRMVKCACSAPKGWSYFQPSLWSYYWPSKEIISCADISLLHHKVFRGCAINIQSKLEVSQQIAVWSQEFYSDDWVSQLHMRVAVKQELSIYPREYWILRSRYGAIFFLMCV